MADIRRQTLRLYYLIKKAHVRVLDEQMRCIGDPYVRQEFREHLNGDESYMPVFLEQWVDYYEKLVNANTLDEFAKELPKEKLSTLTNEQKASLEEIKKVMQTELGNMRQ